MQIVSTGMWTALVNGDRATVRALMHGVIDRLAHEYRHEAILAAMTPAHWEALEQCARVRPYRGPVLQQLIYTSVQGAQRSSTHRVVDVSGDMDRRLPDVLTDGLLLAERYADLMDELWGPGARRSYGWRGEDRPAGVRAVMSAPMASTHEFRRRVHLALREATLFGEDARVLLATPVATPQQFIDLVHFLQARPGHLGVQVARSWAWRGRPVRQAQTYLCARSSVVLDGRPLAVEVALHLDALGRCADKERIAYAREVLGEWGAGDLALAPKVGLRAAHAPTEGIWRWDGSESIARDVFPPDAPPDVATHRWVGHERCQHHNARWETHPTGVSTRLTCPDCYRYALTTIPTHQLPEPRFSQACERLVQERYVVFLRFRAAFEGREPDLVPDTIEALRSADGVRSMQVRDYALLPPVSETPPVRRGTAEGTLVGRRR